MDNCGTNRENDVPDALWAVLTGHRWHATSLNGLHGVVQSGAIEIRPGYNGLCKSLAAVSLFDFGPTAVDIKSGGHWTQWCGSQCIEPKPFIPIYYHLECSGHGVLFDNKTVPVVFRYTLDSLARRSLILDRHHARGLLVTQSTTDLEPLRYEYQSNLTARTHLIFVNALVLWAIIQVIGKAIRHWWP